MLIFNRSRAHNRVNDKMVIFKVSSSIEVTRTPHSGIGQYLTLTGYISVLT